MFLAILEYSKPIVKTVLLAGVIILSWSCFIANQNSQDKHATLAGKRIDSAAKLVYSIVTSYILLRALHLLTEQFLCCIMQSLILSFFSPDFIGSYR